MFWLVALSANTCLCVEKIRKFETFFQHFSSLVLAELAMREIALVYEVSQIFMILSMKIVACS